ncbi:glycosyltransferase [Akkermansia sp. N21116]|uniref:glycosyltransferase n=1 Tax=Akkermansia sp. N21116 TaxID=3040764 RepID=UPI00244ED231|nr:glycosyltransferase [Akkermansia sp. N21116]WPX39855.1 glycosyltransferase [Akkermansia sp. N21116]
MNQTNLEIINIAFTISDDYIKHCCNCILSILENNKNNFFKFYVISDDLTDCSKNMVDLSLCNYNNFEIEYLKFEKNINEFPITLSHISIHTYYRLFLASLLEDIDRVLYLDSDIIVNGPLLELWKIDLNLFYCAGSEDLFIKKINYKKEIGFEDDDIYINAGVLLLNLRKIRNEDVECLFFKNISNFGSKIKFQDQDILNITFRGKVHIVSEKYNFCNENAQKTSIDFSPIIIHYTSYYKPWKYREGDFNSLNFLYYKYLNKTYWKKEVFQYKKHRIIHCMKSIRKNVSKKFRKIWLSAFRIKFEKRNSRVRMFFVPFYSRKRENNNVITRILGVKVNVENREKIRVALIVDEFFGAAGTAFGGYGFLARNLIAKYLPCEEIELEVVLNENKKIRKVKKFVIDNGINVYILPSGKKAKDFFFKKDYDIYLSIEMTTDILKYDDDPKNHLICWIQDPRPWSDWQELQTVQIFPEPCYWNSSIYDLVSYWYYTNRVTFVSQGYFLNDKAKILYRLPKDAIIKYMPNPIDANNVWQEKEDSVIFVGRIESVKRGWLFCEIAKLIPDLKFYMVGQAFRDKEKNQNIMDKYSSIPNLHFLGHLEGGDKYKYLSKSKILVNTSIHEALPITFLEALSCGTLLVSCQNPEDLTQKFGNYIGPVMGDGFDSVPLFVNAIRDLLSDSVRYNRMSMDAVNYINNVHSVDEFQKNMRNLIIESVKNV